MKSIEGAVAAWIKSVRTNTSSRNPATIHIDELLGGAPVNMFQAAIQAFVALVRMIDAPQVLTPILVLPLGSSHTLDLTKPSWSDLVDLVYIEPPSLAIMDPMARVLIEEVEEYRCFLELDELLEQLGSVKFVAYYRCFRSKLFVEKGWEYERCVYVEAVTADQLL